MSRYRTGTFTNATPAVARDVVLGFEPSRVQVTCVDTSFDAATTNMIQSNWYSNMPDASALVTNNDGSSLVEREFITSNGITPFATGADFPVTDIAITATSNATPVVVDTNGDHGFSTGDIVTISGVSGATGLNTNRYKIVVVDADEFSLWDYNGNPISGASVGGAGTGGVANKISGTTVDEGTAGFTIGTGAIGPDGAVMVWEAWYDDPAVY